MKKALFIIVFIIILGAIAFMLSIGEAPEDVERAELEDVDSEQVEQNEEPSDLVKNISEEVKDFDLSNLSFQFVGYGPGKEHVGTFQRFSINNLDASETILGSTITFYIDSIKTDTAKLDSDLCKDNFFDCENYNEITFTLTNITQESEGNLIATGNLELKGETKEISFPVVMADNSYSADFVVSMMPFGFTAPGIVDDEVRIQFTAQK